MDLGGSSRTNLFEFERKCRGQGSCTSQQQGGMGDGEEEKKP